jgi:Asp-tRNA(Asn)/Glu-tRNA(Gln) amidotransferase A subunit family amidase
MVVTKGRVSGVALRALVGAMKGRPARRLLASLVRRQLGIEALGEIEETARAPLPQDVYPTRARDRVAREFARLEPPPVRGWPRSVRALHAAYTATGTNPESVVDRSLRHARQLTTLTPSRGPLMTYDESAPRCAAESRARIASESPHGLLDGIPVAIQEAIDVHGQPSRQGSAWRGSTPAAQDATLVGRLRAAGAVIVGQAPMSEHGLNPFGINPHRSMPRNVHDPTRLAGGSATGAAVAVATGVTPVAVGLGGGGALRIPASLNGVFAIKPTYGRIPSSGCGDRSGSTIATPGIVGTSTDDLAIVLDILAGADPEDRASLRQPPLTRGELTSALECGVAGLRIGVEEQEWVAAGAATARLGRRALQALEQAGAELVNIRMPMALHAPPIGYVTFGAEALAGLRVARTDHRALLGPDTQLLVAALGQSSPDDYLDAQRLRETLRTEVAEVLRQVDVIALPMTVQTAPRVADREANAGFVNTMELDGLCRFAFLADLTGLPAATGPVGMDEDGLPVGLQIVGDAWDEAAVLQVLAHLERLEVSVPARSPIAVDLLEG